MSHPDGQQSAFVFQSCGHHAVLITSDRRELRSESDEDSPGWGHFYFGTRWVARRQPGDGWLAEEGRPDNPLLVQRNSAQRAFVSQFLLQTVLIFHPHNLSPAGIISSSSKKKNLHLAYLPVHPVESCSDSLDGSAPLH